MYIITFLIGNNEQQKLVHGSLELSRFLQAQERKPGYELVEIRQVLI